MEKINDDFKKLHTENKEVIILGDLNINLLNNKHTDSMKIHPLFKKYKEFLTNFGLKQIIKSPTRVTCETSSIIDHILTNSNDRISQSGVIDLGISDHQMIFCTRKIMRVRSGIQKNINFRSFKNYSPEDFENLLYEQTFPNYEKFNNIDEAYSNFMTTISKVIDDTAPIKRKRIKNNSQEWFDGEIAEKIAIRDKNLTKFKKSKLQVDNQIYHESKKEVQHLIKHKKQEFFLNKLNGNIGKPKELWKAIKNLGLPTKSTPTSNICLKDNGKNIFDPKI